MIKNAYLPACEVPFILVRLEWTLNFLDRFSKNTRMLRYMKIQPMGAELFHTDRQVTDRHEKANGRFSQFFERS
jgi:hypothetical protein